MEIFKDLVKVSDVFVENNVVDRMDNLGIDYPMLKGLKEDIVMLRMPAYGTDGAYRDFRALGVHIEGVIGHTILRGYTDMDPSGNTPVYMADAAGGSHGAFAVLAALHHRRRTGKGQYIELGQAEDAMPMMGQFFMDYTMNGRNAATTGNRHPTAIQGCYPCLGDDRWVCITIHSDDEWRAFSQALGNPTWAVDPRFADAPGRLERHDEIDSHISQWTQQMNNFEVMRLLQGAGIAAGPVMNQQDAYGDSHLKERDVFQEASQQDTGTLPYPRAPYTMSETPPDIHRGPVRLGEDNEYVYKTVLGYSDATYAELEAEGHISMDYPEHLE
jgi:crotonobetainyl-CoA:carnitine CoA-transferase CaiB-like acyl-CoA transferase